jgi:Zn-dependent peptidase ImmA (M78 family)
MLLPGDRLIVLNAAERAVGRNELRRARFTIAHEIGHWICHANEGAQPAPVYCRQADLARDADRALEREANVFAAELLMPENAVREAWRNTWDIERCASALGVSVEAVHWRLFSFGLVAEPPRKLLTRDKTGAA